MQSCKKDLDSKNQYLSLCPIQSFDSESVRAFRLLPRVLSMTIILLFMERKLIRGKRVVFLSTECLSFQKSHVVTDA